MYNMLSISRNWAIIYLREPPAKALKKNHQSQVKMVARKITRLCLDLFKVIFFTVCAMANHHQTTIWNTPLETNMSPENQWLEDVLPTEIVPF